MLQRHDSGDHQVTEAPSLTGNTATPQVEEIFTTVSEAELAELTARVQEGCAENKQRFKRFQKFNLSLSLVTAFCIVACGVGVIYAGLHKMVSLDMMLKMLPFLLLPLAVQALALKSGIGRMKRYRNTEPQLLVVQKLLAMEDVRAVVLLLDASALAATARGPEFWQAMGRLLPRMTETEIQELGSERHGALAAWISGCDAAVNRKLFANAGEDFLPNLLAVMGVIGRSSFQVKVASMTVPVRLLPTLTKWANGKGSGRNPAVQQAAATCREAIEQKLELARTGTQLLRASAPSSVGSESLLRPAVGGQQTSPEELLRPGGSEEERISK